MNFLQLDRAGANSKFLIQELALRNIANGGRVGGGPKNKKKLGFYPKTHIFVKFDPK